MEQWIYFILFGAVAGWIASLLMRGGGLGLLGNIVVGILGAIIGGWLSKVTGIYSDGSMLGSLLTAVVGAVVLLFVVRLVKRA